MSAEDLLGIKPIAKAVEKINDEAAEYLGLMFKPAATEVGLLLRDQVHLWRKQRMAQIALRSKAMSTKLGLPPNTSIDSRILFEILEQGSKTSDEQLTDMWAGLLTASRSNTPNDQNIMYINRLQRMTAIEAKVFEYVYQNVEPYGEQTRETVIQLPRMNVATADLMHAMGQDDVGPLDQALDDLRSMGLMHAGIESQLQERVKITPTSLGMNMYLACQGMDPGR
jgi:hypothetical protein